MRALYLENCSWEVDYFKHDIIQGIDEIDMEFINLTSIQNLEYDTTIKNNCVLIVNDSCPFDYVEKVVKKIKPVILFHLSDEIGTIPQWLSLSKYTKILFRQYNHASYNIDSYTNVTQIPLGYMKNMLKQKCSLEIEHIPVQSRKYIWSFVGNMKSDRKEMCDKFKAAFPKCCCVTDNSMPSDKINDVYKDTIFVPNGRGNVTLDCFRLYESCILGAISVVVGSEDEIKHVFYYNGDRPPFVYSDTWDNAVLKCKELLANPQKLEELQKENISWWKRQMTNIQETIKKTLEEHDEDDYMSDE